MTRTSRPCSSAQSVRSRMKWEAGMTFSGVPPSPAPKAGTTCSTRREQNFHLAAGHSRAGGSSPSLARSWSADFSSRRRSASAVASSTSCKGRPTRRGCRSPPLMGRPAWSPDGSRIAFAPVGRRQLSDLRHERRRERAAKANPEPGRLRFFLVARRAEDHIPKMGRRPHVLLLPGLCHERRRERAAEADA